MSQCGLLGGLGLDDGQVRAGQHRPTARHRPGEAGKLAEALLRVLLDGLLQGGDVAKGEQKEHHHVLLVLDGRNLQQQP